MHIYFHNNYKTNKAIIFKVWGCQESAFRWGFWERQERGKGFQIDTGVIIWVWMAGKPIHSLWLQLTHYAKASRSLCIQGQPELYIETQF